MQIPCDVLSVLNNVMFLCYQYGFVAWLLSTSVGLSLSFLRYYGFFFSLLDYRHHFSQWSQDYAIHWTATNFPHMVTFLCSHYKHHACFCSKSSVLLGISLTVPLMAACLSIAVPIWMHNGYQFWVPQLSCGDQARDSRSPRIKVCLFSLT